MSMAATACAKIECGAPDGDGLQLAPVDLKHLRRYTLGDVGLEKEVLHLFLDQLPSTLMALGGAKTEKDWKVAAHTLKGSGRAVGAWRIARIAEQAERSDFLKRPQLAAEMMMLLESAANEAKAFIAASYD
jgi:HPt (histidine-containing phosphotransfer) domain-containing protein